MNSWIGIRVEIASRVMPDDLDSFISDYNDSSREKIIKAKQNCKIGVIKTSTSITATGGNAKNNAVKNGIAMLNFGLVLPIDESKLGRLVQIVNVLGNGRLIRERIVDFVDGTSVLTQLPELKPLQLAIEGIEISAPGFINGGWYFAPEILNDDK